MTNRPFPQTRIFPVFIIKLVFCTVSLPAAAPLNNGFDLAPPALASSAEKTAAFHEARLQVLAAAGKYEHTPYRYGGLDRRGLDCSGLVYVSFHDALGVVVPRNTWGLYSWVEKIPIENANPGDLLFFKTGGNGAISHVGIFVGGKRFIHAASEGPVTGVIYSSLDEGYWSRTYAGAGRALPETGTGAGSGVTGKKPARAQNKQESRLLMGFAAAPTWNTFSPDGVVRGFAGQLRVGVAGEPFGQPMLFGMELRPEWDGALGVFRLPLTLSWGINDKLRFFAGPVISFGDATLPVSGEIRHYTGGTNWFGAAGITVAPFAIKIAGNELAPYGEMAWQSYSSTNARRNIGADFAAGFRFSTGIRYTWKL
ncbi:MAG: C40 family peptidase [Treponema sp.]|jgi:probable lipoprotein NlpC|nr:C40 family peptidase [Treponema sp.]